MSNTTTGAWETDIAERAQKFLDKMPLYRTLGNFEMKSKMKRGREVNRPIFNPGQLRMNDYTPNTDVDATDWRYDQENMVVNLEKAARLESDPNEELDLQIAGHRALLAKRLYQASDMELDRAFLSEVANSALDVDDSDFGGSIGNPIDLATTNAERAFGQAYAELSDNAGNGERMYAVIDAFHEDEISNRAIESTFKLADKFFQKPLDKMFKGFDLYVTRNLPTTVTLTYTGVGTTAKTFKLKGVSFNQVTTIGAVAGNVLMATSATVCATNVKNFINNPETTSATQVALSAKDVNKMYNAGISATSSAGVVTITAYGRLQPKYTSVDANASFNDEALSVLCGIYGNIDMVVQEQPTVRIRDHQKNIGSSLIGTTRAAHKMYSDGAERSLKLLLK